MDKLGASTDENNELKQHPDQPYDESLEIQNAEDVLSQYEATPRVFHDQRFKMDNQFKLKSDDDTNLDDEDEDDDEDDEDEEDEGSNNKVTFNSDRRNEGEDEDEDDEEDDDDDDHTKSMAYKSSDFQDLSVANEVKELFQYITRYTPQRTNLEARLKPLLFDYLPAVGDVDAFLKIPRPDNKTDKLGLTVVDEPNVRQTDRNVFDLMLRSLTTSGNANQSNNKIPVKSVNTAEEGTHKHINQWIKDIEKLHRSKPSASVHYKKKMPDMNDLMQEWEEPVENILNEDSLPFDLDCDLATMVHLVCGVCNIPVHDNNTIQSLHLLFSLYVEFKNSQHFQRTRRN